MDRLDRNPPITAQEHDVEKVKKVTLVAAIGGLRTDLSLTSKTDGNFGNVATGVLFSKVAYQRKKDVYAWNFLYEGNSGHIENMLLNETAV